MTWLVWALLAHAGNGLVFIVNKGLLGSGEPIGEPWRLAYYSGLASGATGVLLVLGWTPLTGVVALWSLVAGACFTLASWWFFAALQAGESSRVVPMIGSVVAVATWFLAGVFLGEQLGAREALGAGLLIVGGAMLAARWADVKGMSGKLIGFIVAGGLAFGAYFTAVKYLYAQPGTFFGLFAYSRIGVAVASVVIFSPWLWAERGKKKERVVAAEKRSRRRWLAGIFVGNKLMGSGSFLLQSYAIKAGSVTIVNALQGTQYALVLAVAAILSVWQPKVWQEELSRIALTQKIVGIVIVSVGLWLLV